MKNRKIIYLLFSFVFLLFNSCKDDDDICYTTITHYDGHGNSWETEMEYPCHLGPPVDASVTVD